MEETWAEETRRRANIMLAASLGAEVECRSKIGHDDDWEFLGRAVWNWRDFDYRFAEPPEHDGTCGDECECCQEAELPNPVPLKAVVVLQDRTALFGYEMPGGTPFRVRLQQVRTVDIDGVDAADVMDLALRGPSELGVSRPVPCVMVPDPTLIAECTRDAVRGWESGHEGA